MGLFNESFVNNKYVIQVQISDMPNYKDTNGDPISRVVNVSKIILDFENESIIMECNVKYYNINLEDITSDFAPKRVTLPANSKMVIDDTDELGNPIMETVYEQEVVDGQPVFHYDGSPKLIEVQRQRRISFYYKLIPLLDYPISFSSVAKKYIGFNVEKFN